MMCKMTHYTVIHASSSLSFIQGHDLFRVTKWEVEHAVKGTTRVRKPDPDWLIRTLRYLLTIFFNIQHVRSNVFLKGLVAPFSLFDGSLTDLKKGK